MDKPSVPSFLPVSAMMLAMATTFAAFIFVEFDISPLLALIGAPFIGLVAHMEYADRVSRQQIYDQLAVEFTTQPDEVNELDRRVARMRAALAE
jgi:uncharacterized protein involved in cysteine biosynthesis